ncbi:MAG TPA: FtsX-like permease family protein, partial [Vicinamibacterales bacterium]|nr:FtsX-like permease family protein [Vicinamibacterales bacterium]
TALLRGRHHLAPTAQDDFTITNPRAAMARVTEVGSTLATVLTGIGVLSTIVGGVVITSLMLMAVSERRREIGVRRSVGASQGDVLVQFLGEAVAVSVLGGLVGVLFGAGSSAIATIVQQLPPTIAWSSIAGAIVTSIGLGVVFGLQPAWKASTVDPIAALRS